MLLKNNIIFSKKKIDLVKVSEIFWKKKIKITLFLFLFMTFFYFVGIIQKQKYITIVNIYNNYFIQNYNNIQLHPSEMSFQEPLDNRYKLLNKISNNTLRELFETNFFGILEEKLNTNNFYEEFLKIYPSFDKTLDVPKLVVKKVPKKIELHFLHNGNDTKELINQYIEYIFDLTFLEHKRQIEKNIKISLINEIGVINVCENLAKRPIQDDSCNILKEQYNFNKERLKSLDKVKKYRDLDPDFVFYNIIYSSALMKKKIELYITFGFLMGLFVSGLLFFNLDTRRFK